MLVACARKEQAMDFAQVSWFEFGDVSGKGYRAFQRCDIREDALGGEVTRISRTPGFRETSMREHESLDSGRGNRFGAKELPGEYFEARQRLWGIRVPTCLFGSRSGSRYV